jgi:hypothetical protein
MFRSRNRAAHSSGGSANAVRRPSRRAQSAVVVAVALASGSVLMLSGALDPGTAEEVHSESPPSTLASSVPTTVARPAPDSSMIGYLTAQRSWIACMSAASSTTSCGAPPTQPDSAQLNAYLAAVLDWNKCAAPRLRHGGLGYAEDACGPQPTSPLDG